MTATESETTASAPTDATSARPPAPQGASLAAEPAVRALRALRADSYLADGDVAVFAAGLGLPADLTTRLLDGKLTRLEVGDIAAVCEALHCSPYDLWGADEARTVLHVYGPERWPRHIAPLDELDGPSDDRFLARRLEAQAAEILTTDGNAQPPDGVSRPTVEVLVTPYRESGIVAITSDGRVTPVIDVRAPADDLAEYHWRFTQVDNPRRVAIRIGADGMGACDASTEAALAMVAQDCRLLIDRASVAMVRFTDSKTGIEAWLGWDDTAQTWHQWDDPRRYWPGDPQDVLDAGRFDTPLTAAHGPTHLTADDWADRREAFPSPAAEDWTSPPFGL